MSKYYFQPTIEFKKYKVEYIWKVKPVFPFGYICHKKPMWSFLTLGMGQAEILPPEIQEDYTHK